MQVPVLIYSQRCEVDSLQPFWQSYSGDRRKMEQEAERLGKYENLH
jgi:hypothetical protein